MHQLESDNKLETFGLPSERELLDSLNIVFDSLTIT